MPDSRFAQAMQYMLSRHAGQVRKDGRATIGHILAVTSLVLEYGGDEDQVIGGLLHDTLEDCGRELRGEIRERFGERVGRIVDACSDPEFSKPKPPWAERKRVYLEQIRAADADAHLVACCDKLANARVILADFRQVGDEVWARVKGEKAERIWYLRACLELAEAVAPKRLADDLRFVTLAIVGAGGS